LKAAIFATAYSCLEWAFTLDQCGFRRNSGTRHLKNGVTNHICHGSGASCSSGVDLVKAAVVCNFWAAGETELAQSDHPRVTATPRKLVLVMRATGRSRCVASLCITAFAARESKRICGKCPVPCQLVPLRCSLFFKAMPSMLSVIDALPSSK